MPFPATHPALALALAEQGYDEPTPVQAAVLERGADDRDLLERMAAAARQTAVQRFSLQALAPQLWQALGVTREEASGGQGA